MFCDITSPVNTKSFFLMKHPRDLRADTTEANTTSTENYQSTERALTKKKNVHTRNINTATTSLYRVAYFSYVTRDVMILSQKTQPLQPHINWESYVSKRLISSKKEFSKLSIYESYSSVYQISYFSAKNINVNKRTNYLAEIKILLYIS